MTAFDLQRFRCIPTTLLHGSWYAWGADAAEAEAEVYFAENDGPVKIVHAPAGGLVRKHLTVGMEDATRRIKR